MIKKIVMLGMLVILGISACKSKRKSENNVQHNQHELQQEIVDVTAAQKDTISNLILSFISIGSGTDGKARTRFLTYLEKFQSENNIVLAVDTRTWGREGEVDYCINTSNITKDNLAELKINLKNMFDGNTLVRQLENKPCRAAR